FLFANRQSDRCNRAQAVAAGGRTVRLELEPQLDVDGAVAVAQDEAAQPLDVRRAHGTLQRRIATPYLCRIAGRRLRHEDIEQQQIPRRKADEAVAKEARLVIEVAERVADHRDEPA